MSKVKDTATLAVEDKLISECDSNIGSTDLLNTDLPNINFSQIQAIDIESLIGVNDPRHAPRILVLYGSLRARSFSRLAAEEASRLLRWYGCAGHRRSHHETHKAERQKTCELTLHCNHQRAQ